MTEVDLTQILAIATCGGCHHWVVIPAFGMGRCRRCKRIPRLDGIAVAGATTTCLHEGDCRGAE